MSDCADVQVAQHLKFDFSGHEDRYRARCLVHRYRGTNTTDRAEARREADEHNREHSSVPATATH